MPDLHMMDNEGDGPMPMIDLMPTDATYISCDHPDADYSRACALVAATGWRRGMTEVILLKYPRTSLPVGAAVERAELVLYPWRNRETERNPAFCIYSIKSDSRGSHTAWDRRLELANFPQASQPASACGKDGSIHCDITSLVEGWLCGGERHCSIAVVADAGECLMVHSACSAHPPCLRLLYCDGQPTKAPKEERRGHECGPAHEQHCAWQMLCGYREKVYTLDICTDTAYTPAVDISQARTVTFFIKNYCCTAIDAALQVSPDSLDWMDDKQGITVSPDGLTAITPYLFARYIRVGVSPARSMASGKVRVWYQAQSLNYQLE